MHINTMFMDSRKDNIIANLGMSFITVQIAWKSACYQYCTLTLFRPWWINHSTESLTETNWLGVMTALQCLDYGFPLSKEGGKKWLDCLNWNGMIYFQLRVPYFLTHKAICFCSYFQLITLTERAHSLSCDKVWWWRLMMSASSHHHLASSKLFCFCLPLPSLSVITLKEWLFLSKRNLCWYNKWKSKTFVVVNMQMSLLTCSWLSLFTSCIIAIS